MKRPSRLYTLMASLLTVAALTSPVLANPQDRAQDQDPPRPQTDPPPPTDAATPAPRSFEELDANGDGSIGKDEAAVDPALTQAFGTLDQDADGKLTPAEYGAYRPADRSSGG